MVPGSIDQVVTMPSEPVTKLIVPLGLLEASTAAILAMLAIGVWKSCSPGAANFLLRSHCRRRWRSTAFLLRLVRFWFLNLRASRSTSFSSPALAVASSPEICSSSSLGFPLPLPIYFSHVDVAV
jgi:hypothetical protein